MSTRHIYHTDVWHSRALFFRSETTAKESGEPGRAWKAFYLPAEGEAQRLATGMPADVCECAPIGILPIER
ncbi:MAG: hypothetical protein AAB215_09170 [Planctomycetota bacterium]